MAVLPVPISPDVVANVAWVEYLAGLAPPACSEASSVLHKAAREAETRGETDLVSVLDLLGVVCRFYLALELDDAENGPYEPQGRTEEGRTPLPEDLSSDELDVLAVMLDQGMLPNDLAARLCDILVIRMKDYRRGRDAINHYLAAAEELAAADAAHLTASRLQRAVQLAARFGSKKGKDVDRVLLMAGRLLRDPASGARGRSISIVDVVLDRQYPDPSAFATLIEELAREEEAGGDPFAAKELYDRAGRAWQKAGDEAKAHAAYAEAAECHVRIAESGPGGAFRATHLESAIKAYQKVPGSEARRTELRQLMLASQKVAVGEMGQISTPFDVSDAAAAAAEQVRGLPWLSAVFEMALGILDPHDPDEVEAQTIEMAQATPFMTLIGATFMNEHGRTVAKKPDAFSDEEGALRAEVQSHASLTRQYDVPGRIRPARCQILSDHGLHREAFASLAAQSVFVPPGRAKMFGKALAAGAKGDFLVSTTLLPPLIEHALLVLLLRRGVIQGPLTEEEVSRRYSLNTTLRGDLGAAVAAALGADVHFTLSALLVNRFGGNLRNRIAHGLVSDGGIYSADAEYLWWLALRLCCVSYRGAPPPGFERRS
ncbi:MAG: DUF4209 domain-containing protein, partial [Bacteroidota bacterium]